MTGRELPPANATVSGHFLNGHPVIDKPKPSLQLLNWYLSTLRLVRAQFKVIANGTLWEKMTAPRKPVNCISRSLYSIESRHVNQLSGEKGVVTHSLYY
jgi:hypothetical protein